MRIYISGPIRGRENAWEEIFTNAAETLRSLGHEVVNVAEVKKILPEGLTAEEHLRIDLALLDACDGIYMLSGWKESLGANREYGYALGRGLQVYGNVERIEKTPVPGAVNGEVW